MPHAIEKIMGSRVVLGQEKAGKSPPSPDSKDYPGYASQFTGSNVKRRKKKGGTSVSS
jgi:hypothetical protein